MNELATRFGLHPTQIAQWKKQALEGLPEIFGNHERLHQALGYRMPAEVHAESVRWKTAARGAKAGGEFSVGGSHVR